MAKLKIVKSKSDQAPKTPKKFQKITPKLIVQALAILAIFGVFIFAMPNLPQMPTTDANVRYQGVINLWLVDSFEGGSGSRQTWFTKRASLFERQNKGLFVCVTTLSEYQLADKLAMGQTFDIICFSRGVGATICDKLTPLDVDFGSINANFIESGRVNKTTYALPVYSGAYCLFARASQQKGDVLANCLTTTFIRKIGKNTVTLNPLVCGFAKHNSPLTALAMSGGKGNFAPDYALSQYTAYEQFVANKTAVTLLGSQRDIYRLSKRLEIGKMEDLLFAPLTSYTDLVAYVGVSNSTANAQPCLDFANYLLSDAVQQSLVDISMFSVTNRNLYTHEWYSLCEKGLATAYVPNVFSDAETISKSRNTALSTLQTP